MLGTPRRLAEDVLTKTSSPRKLRREDEKSAKGDWNRAKANEVWKRFSYMLLVIRSPQRR
jgi:hypothetical protein